MLGGFPKLGVPFLGGLYKKDHTILDDFSKLGVTFLVVSIIRII